MRRPWSSRQRVVATLLAIALSAVGLVVGVVSAPTANADMPVPPGEPAALTTVTLAGGDVVPLAGPARLLDTAGGLGPHSTASFLVSGRAGIPAAGVSAVVGRVRVVTPSVAGNATVYPNGGVRPSSTTLQFGAGATRETLTFAVIGAGGRVILYNGSSRALRFAFDATGYVPDTAEYTSLPAIPRVLSASAGSVAAAGTKTFAVGGLNGVPSTGIGAVVTRVSVVGPTTNGTATLYSAGHARPGAATLAWHAGAATETLAMVPLGDAGRLTLHNEAAHSAGFNVDVLGYILDTSTYHPLSAPARLLNATTAPNADTTVKLAGRSGIPASGIGTVVARVGVVAPTIAANATVFPAGTSRPTGTTLVYGAGATANTLTIIPLSADGKVTVHNGGAKSTRFTIDVLGWFDVVTAAQQSTKFVLPATTRLAGQNDIATANADVTSVKLRPTADVPPVGGHLIVPPRADGSRGITAEVIASVAVSGGTQLTLADSPVYDAVSDMQVHDHRVLRTAPSPSVAAPGAAGPRALSGSSLGLHLADFGPVECSADGVTLEQLLPAVQLTLDDLRVEFDYSLSDRYIHFALIGTANGIATVHIPGNYSCTASIDTPIDVPMGWLDAGVGIGLTLGVGVSAGTVDVNLTASSPAELGFEYVDGETHNLSSLSFAGNASMGGIGSGAFATLTPFVQLELGFITRRLVSPVVDVNLGLQFGVGPNPDGYFGPKCESITVAPTISLSAALQIEFFRDISVTIGSYTLPPLHLWDGPCISYAGSIHLHQDFANSDILGSQHFVQDVTMTFDGTLPAKYSDTALWEPYSWDGTQTEDTTQACGAHAHQVDNGPGSALTYDTAQMLVAPDGPAEGGRVFTNFQGAPIRSEVTGLDCGGVPFGGCCEGFGAIYVYNYDGFTDLPTLGVGGIGGPITGTGTGTATQGTATTQVTVAYALSPVEVTPP